jgi:hypothetical protein
MVRPLFGSAAHPSTAVMRWVNFQTLKRCPCRSRAGVVPLAYLTEELQRIVSGHSKSHELHALLPWN